MPDLTKTDFMLYLQCPKSLWLKNHKPEVYRNYKKLDHSLRTDGYEVETYTQPLFLGNTSPQVCFQCPLRTDEGMSTYVDVLEKNHDGTYNLYEVKSSTNIKDNHIKDACFQTIASEESGLSVRNVFIIHVNANYVRGATVDPHQLLQKVCVTRKVRNCEAETRAEIAGALTLLSEDAIDERGCECYWKTRSNHCDAFNHFNRIPQKNSVWELTRISENKLRILLNQDIKRLESIPQDITLNAKQSAQVHSARTGGPIVQKQPIADMLNTLVFPLYFLDYETASGAVPKMPDTKPWQHIPFQFSLHILHENGSLEHKDYLSKTLTLCGVKDVLHALCDSVGSVGSVIVWHAQFEKSRNCEMGKLFPEYRDHLEDINRRIFDLEDIFKEAYIDARFCGSTSIKKVLPVMCPHLSYENLEVQDGMQAMEQWFVMLNATGSNRLAIRNALLEYCELDTYAMVKLYCALLNLSNNRAVQPHFPQGDLP